jgi:hypothetical protein
MANPVAERIARQTLHRLGTPTRVAARYVAADKLKELDEPLDEKQEKSAALKSENR